MTVRRIPALWLAVVMGSAAFCGCAKPPAPPINIEQPPAPQAIASVDLPPQSSETSKLPPPKLEEVQETVKRIFKDVVVIDASRNPSYLPGDFNGDLSQDLAVVLRPAEGKLSELNQEFPSWIAREPLKEVLLPKSKAMAQPGAASPSQNPAAGQTIRFEQRDVLLAIIHGIGQKGWRDHEATQTHILRDVVGAEMRTLAFKRAAQVYRGVKPFPFIYGDLIQETLIGQSGFLHFTGGVYGWYDPKNYRPTTTTMPRHSRMSAMIANPKPGSPDPAGTHR